MTYVLITVAQKMPKGGDLIAKVIAVGDITEGTSDKGKWQKQEATLKDNSGQVKLTMWNKDVGLLDQGQHYKFDGLYWKPYKDVLTPQIGKYTKTTLALPENLLELGEISSEPVKPETSPDDIPGVPKLPEEIAAVIQAKARELLQIEENVVIILKTYRPHEVKNGQKIGMMVKAIFEFLHGGKSK